MGNVQTIELIWTLLAFTGWAFSLYNDLDSYLDYHDSKRLQNGLRRAAMTTALTACIMEVLRSVQLTALLAVGLYAMILPPEPEPRVNPGSETIIILLFFTYASFLTANTIVSFYGRRRVLAELGVRGTSISMKDRIRDRWGRT